VTPLAGGSRPRGSSHRHTLPSVWLGSRRGYLADWVTQTWVKATGRQVDLDQQPWIQGPIGGTRAIGEEWFRGLAQQMDADLIVNAPGAGLIASFDDLAGPDFDPVLVDPEIHRFYQHTVDYQLEMTPGWQPGYRALARLLMVVFARRLQQMNIPFTAADTRGGVRSDILQIVSRTSGQVLVTGWLRRLVATGEVVYAGCYSIATLPGGVQPVIKVVFPLPNGNASVFLTPNAEGDHSFTLVSSGRTWGGDGFYFVVRQTERGAGGERAWVRPVALSERIHVHTDGPAALTTEHEMRLWRRLFLRLRYQMVRAGSERAAA
jgi:hypothetical protein